MRGTPEISDGLDHVRHLADTIGRRMTGSEGERRAARYQCDVLSSWGCQQVGTEPFAARGWDFDVCEVQCEALGVIDALPIEFSASTHDGGLEAELVICERPDVVAGQLQGRIALFYGALPEPEVLLAAAPAAAILVTPDRARAWHQIIGPHSALADRLPMVTLGFADGVELVRHGVSRLRLLVSTTIGEVQGLNVVASLPGTDADAGRILVSGHYDSVPAGGAASDNAAGAACALEVMHALSQVERRASIDFVNYSAEEIGLYGAEAHAQQHAGALAETRLGIYFDGQGDFLGRNNIHVMGQQELADFVRARCDESGYVADVQHHFTGLDQVFVSAHGVPTLWFQRSPQLTWHTRADISADISPAAMHASIAAAVDIVLQTSENQEAFPGGIPVDQATEIRTYVRSGAPCW